MEKITIAFPDGSKKEYEKGISAGDIAKSIGPRLYSDAVAAKFNSGLHDLNTKITKDTTIEFVTFDSREGKDVFWHSASHILAQAVTRIFPDARMTIGPAVDDGFYYDFETKKPFSKEDLENIEAEIDKIIKADIEIKRLEVSKEEGRKRFAKNPYKLELIDDLGDEQITIYEQGDFCDLCRGPHVPSTGRVKAIKLMKIAGAYWRGDAKNQQLQRVYGVAFPDKKELRKYLNMLQEAEKRDHRKIGKDLKLFSFHEEGPGFPFFHPKGMIIWNELISFWQHEHRKAVYKEVKTPIILSKKLWECSGHWENYSENMYITEIDGQPFAIKPMNCPGGMLMYKEHVHSYREFPLRVGEIGLVHRHELSGTLSGLFRVRSFHQDDAHIFMTPSQIKDEILGVLNLADRFYRVFGLEYHLELSTRPEKSIGTDEQWKKATDGLREALDSTGKEYQINEGDGAFYGPKIDFHIKDSLGRTWQCGTIQLDMSLPERFDLTYIGEDGSEHRPVMIHRVIYGALERFLGIITEHYAGRFPLWLSPVQARILTISDKFLDFAKQAEKKMQEAGLRVELDSRSESVSKKVRDAQTDKVNYILVIGEREVEARSVNVRTRDGKVHGTRVVDELIKELQKEIADKKQ
jgi:threonyl-tRNA synthetase